MTYLADVNVWLAQSYTGHVHHRSARAWFEESENDTIAFCRLTQSGLLRLLTNRKVMGDDVLSTLGAWKVYDGLLRTNGIVFAAEPDGLELAWREATEYPRSGPNFWTDAYLSAFASAADLTIVTFDRAFRHHRGTRVKVLSGS